MQLSRSLMRIQHFADTGNDRTFMKVADSRMVRRCDLPGSWFAEAGFAPNTFFQAAWPTRSWSSGGCVEFGRLRLGGRRRVGAVFSEQCPEDVDAAAG